MATLAERFAARVDRTDTHHVWLGAVDQHGVPQMRVDGRLTTARRIAWELQRGLLPKGARIRGCPAESRCVHADHLTLIERQPPPRAARTRRPRGEGSLREIRPDVWKLTVTTPSRQRVSRTIGGDRGLAEVQLARLAARHGHRPATLDALVHLYLLHLIDAGRSSTTVRRYEQLWRTWLAPSLASTAPDGLRTRDVEVSLTAMAHAGQSPRSIHQAAVVLNATFAWGREHGLASNNPILDCELPDGTVLTGTRRR